MREIKIKDLIGKTIKKIDTDYYNGCLIEFTEGTKISFKTDEYPNGGYCSTIIEEVKE